MSKCEQADNCKKFSNRDKCLDTVFVYCDEYEVINKVKNQTEKIVVVCDKDGCNKCKLAIWDEELCYYICGLGKFLQIGDVVTIEIKRAENNVQGG